MDLLENLSVNIPVENEDEVIVGSNYVIAASVRTVNQTRISGLLVEVVEINSSVAFPPDFFNGFTNEFVRISVSSTFNSFIGDRQIATGLVIVNVGREIENLPISGRIRLNLALQVRNALIYTGRPSLYRTEGVYMYIYERERETEKNSIYIIYLH